MGISNWVNVWTAIFPLAVLLYYFFRKRYETLTISSTLFWEQSMRETKVSPYLKNLQRNALFYLQMVALLLFVFLLLGPYLEKEETGNGQLIFIMDTSATMLVEKDGVSLFSKQKDEMKKLVEERNGQPVTIVTTGKEPATVLREETDSVVVSLTIDKLSVSYEHEYMERALEFTRSITASNNADIHVFTDSFDRTSLPEGNGNLSWSVYTNDGPINNISIDKFGAIQTTGEMEAIVKLVNQSIDDKQGDMQIKNALTGEVLAEEAFEIEGENELLLSFKELPLIKAIRAEINTNYDYKVDNSAIVLLGSEINDAVVDAKLHELVKKAFEAVGLVVVTGSMNEMSAAQENSIIVTNEVSFLEMGATPIILIGRNDLAAEAAEGEVSSTADSLLSLVDISEVYVSEVYPPIDGFTTIASVGDKPFIQKSSRGDLAILADIEMTDWPLHPSFPLFIWSATEMLRLEADLLGNFVPNERKAIISGELEIYTDSDEYVTTVVDGSSFIAPAHPGVYKTREGDREKLFTVQLEDVEKVVAIGDSFRIGGRESAEGTETGKKTVGTLLLPLLILMLILIEWEVQRRRGYPN